MPDRSIGEVLEELREDFPDVSVSKIRFLESQGLINPRRTPSGYRQFSDDDVELLRWILLQQREHYLPLKVIRKRLRDGDGPRAPGAGGVPQAAADGNGRVHPGPEAAGGSEAPVPVSAPDAVVGPPDVPAPPASPEPPGPAAAPPAPDVPLDEAEAAATEGPPRSPEEGEAAAEAPPAPLAPAVPLAPEEDLWPAPSAGRIYSRRDLAREAELEEGVLAELESFGLLPHRGGVFDEESLRVARLAAGFFRYGVEARHLRMYKSFAEREAAFLEQVVMPMVSPRQEESRARAREALTELARLGQALRLSMLRAALGPTSGD